MSVRSWYPAVVIAAVLVSARAIAAEDDAAKASASLNVSYYAMRDQPDFTVTVAAVNVGAFRIEARHNYEAKGGTSAFLGWRFSGGDNVTFEMTPIAGVLGGSAHGAIGGLEASVGWRAFDAYVEAEYVSDRRNSDDSYFYAWSELGWRPVEWLRVGLAGQRTRVVHTDRDIQRGLFAQGTFGKATIGVYAFNPDTASRYTVASVSLAF